MSSVSIEAARKELVAPSRTVRDGKPSDNGTVVIVSPNFPPSPLAGVHRARHLAKHLPSAGWNPIVLCVHESYHEERLDPVLADLVPKSTEIVKVAALRANLTRPLGIGEISLRAFGSLRRSLIDLLEKRSIDAVMITGSPYYPMLLGNHIRRRFKVPVVLDFQDPWVSAWGAAQPQLSKAGLSHLAGTMLEPRALRSAAFITSVSDRQNDELAARYPWLDRTRMAAIPIGGDPQEFDAALAAELDDRLVQMEPGYIHLCYVGTIWPRVIPSLQTLLRAFSRLRESDPVIAARIRLHFIGTNADPNDLTTHRVRPLAEAEGLGDLVREVPRRLSYLGALRVMARSNGILLIGSDEPHYTASKIFPVLMSRRPFLSLYHRASSAHAILAAAGGGRALAFEASDQLAALEPSLVEGLRVLALHPDSLGSADKAIYAPFLAQNIARRFADIFDSVADTKTAAQTASKAGAI